MEHLSYVAMIITQVTVVVVLSVLSQASSQGITLRLNGSSIENDSYVSIDDIGKDDEALLCHTDKIECCASDRIGEWHFPNGNQVQRLGDARLNANHYFYRNRGKQIVRLSRVMNPPERGRFFCKVPDSSGEIQTIYVNIVKIHEISITPSAPGVGTIGENFTLQCSVYLLQPSSLPKKVSSLLWTWNLPNSNFPTYETEVHVFNPTADGTANYTQLLSTVQFSPLQVSHAGTVSCQVAIEDDETMTANITIIVNVPDISVHINSNKIPVLGQVGFSLTCEIIGAEILDLKVTYKWTKSNGTDFETQFDNSNTLSFNQSLSYSDAGLYMCQLVGINTDFLNGNISLDDCLNLTIQTFTDNPANLSVNRGEMVNLSCSYPLDQSEVNISWTTPPDISLTPIDESDTNINITQSILMFTASDSSYAGDYFCTAYVDGSSVDSAVGVLSLNYVTVEFIMTDYTVMISEEEDFNINMRVTVNGTPPRNVTVNINFQDGGDEVLELNFNASASMNLQVPFDDLNVTREDIIMLELSTTDELVELGSIITMYITINKTESQDFVVHITQVGNEAAGENYTLSCSISPNLTMAVYEWEYQHEIIDNNTENYNGSNREVINHSLKSELLFSPLFESNTGIYTCRVSVGNNMNSSNYTVSVMAPTIAIDIQESGTLSEQQSYTLSCNVSGHEKLANPNIFYVWTKDDMLMQDSTGNITLYLPSLRLSDAAKYKCEVTVGSNYLNSQITANDTHILQLNVSSPAVVRIENSSDTIIAGSSPELKCIVQFTAAVDVPLIVEYKWFGPDGATFMSTNQELIMNFTMYMSTTTIGAAISGNYSCEVMISSSSQFIIGNKNASRHLEIIVDPLPSPTDLKASALSTSIYLTWEQPLGADAVDYYEIRYNFSINECTGSDHSYRSDSILVRINNSSSRSYNIIYDAKTPVEEDSMYYITLTAANSIVSSKVVSTETSTLEAAPVGPPDSISLMNINSTSVKVTWGEVNCTQRNGRITDYHMTYTNPGAEDMAINVTNQFTLTVNGLYPLTQYTFKVAAIKNHEIGPYSRSEPIQTKRPNRVLGFLRGIVLANNSIVTNDEIGSEDDQALLCYTNLAECCHRVHNVRPLLGEWYDPAGNRVLSMGDAMNDNLSMYRNRGPSVVRLHRVMNMMPPSGIFQCEVNDTNGSLQSVYIGVYPENEGIPSVTSLEHVRAENGSHLICTSTDGPPTTVTWRKNGQPLIIDGTRYQQSQRITNPTTATYQNILSSNATNLVGLFTCIVSNARGSDNQSISTNGVFIDDNVEFEIGSNATVFCNSDTPTVRIMWLSDNKIIVSENDTQNLGLNFIPVNDTVHGKVYTCTVERINETEIAKQNFTLYTTVPFDILELTISDNGTYVAGNVFFQLNGGSYSNNSRVNITDIGERDNDSLICVSNNTDCCKDLVGEWYFPNGSVVNVEGAGEPFFRNIGQGVLRLHRRHNAMMPTGPFCCVVPDANGINQRACVIIEAMAAVTDLVTTTTETTRVTTTIRPTEYVIKVQAVNDENMTGPPAELNVNTSIPEEIEEDNVTRNGLEFPTPITTMKDTNIVITDSTSHLFQLRLFEIQNCLEWVNKDASAKIEDILAAITSNINQCCQCGLSHKNIINGVFRCFSSSPQAVTFRALLQGAAKASRSEIISLIEQWISNDMTIPVQSVLINVDSSCTVTISSFDDRECQVIITEQPINESNSPAIIGGAISALLLVLLLASITIIAVLLLWFRKRCKVSIKNFRASKNEIPMTEANLPGDTPHEYEVLDKYSRDYEEIVQVHLTECPAYVPTIHPKTGT